jgi:hypothetical protein
VKYRVLQKYMGLFIEEIAVCGNSDNALEDSRIDSKTPFF